MHKKWIYTVRMIWKDQQVGPLFHYPLKSFILLDVTLFK